MNLKITAIFCFCDDLLKSLNFLDDCQCKMNTSEIMTLGITAALFFNGNIQLSRQFFICHKYFTKILSHSRLNRRLLNISSDIWEAAFWFIREMLIFVFGKSDEFIIDSCPIPVCLPCRSWCCKMYQGKQYLGYCAAKKLYYYGLKLHILISNYGIIYEFSISPASHSDITVFKTLEIDIPSNSYLFGDRAYTSLEKETELLEMGKINFIPQRKRNSKRQHSGVRQFLLKKKRKVVETVLSMITKLFPRSIVAKSPQGFELRIMLFLFAYSFSRL